MNKTITLNEIYELVSDTFKTNLKNQSRKTRFITARFAYFSLSRKYTGKTLQGIGKLTGHRHDSVINGINKIDGLRNAFEDTDIKYKRCEEYIKDKLGIKTEIELIEESLRPSELYVLNALKELSDSDISDFTETRLKTYLNMLKSREKREVKVVRGATMNRHTKSYKVYD